MVQQATYVLLQHLTLAWLCEFVVTVETVFLFVLKQSRWQI